MKRVFLIGDPVAHSVSPEMQNAAFRALGVDWRYDLLPTPLESLAQAVARLRQEDCVGANVTIPQKETIIPFLDGVTDQAEQIGAVNTIVKRAGRLIGDNTDVEGFLQVLEDAPVALVDSHAVILGAGGAARATAFALARSGARSLTLINRTETRADRLVSLLRAHFPGIALSVNQKDDLGHAQVIVNATSVGMVPNIGATPWPREIAFPKGAVAIDLVYRPRRTRFLADAERAGCETIDGLGMLVHQGAAACRLWTGRDAPIQTMFQAAEQALAEQAEQVGSR